MLNKIPVVAIDALTYRWRADHVDVLSIERLRVDAGEKLFLAGHSGSGKSTLLSLLAGVITAQHGSLQVLGRSLADMSGSDRDHFRADHVGMIFQMFNLIPYLSVLDNVTLPLRFSAQRRAHVAGLAHDEHAEARRLLQHLGLQDDSLLQRAVTGLSVGQQQRVAAARALIGAPQLLIADEPTSALDPEHRQAFIELLFRECEEQGSTLLFVSHDHALGGLFDRRLDMAQLNRAPAGGA
jgi:putative ABC transport system ATP-binding protein